MAIPGASGDEQQIANFVRQTLVDAGADPKQIRYDQAHLHTPIDGNTGNLIFKLPGTVRAPRRLLMSHLDTVPICVGSLPVRRGNRLLSGNPGHGIGADNRAGVAVILHTATQLLQSNLPHPPLTFLWTVQEEIGLHGARNANLSMLGNPKLAFNWDGGAADKVTVGATGGYRMQIEIQGLASHAGNAPEQGVSAIAIAAIAIADLQQTGWHGDIRKNGRRGTSNIGVIQGGNATNVVADHVFLRAEARSHDASFRKQIVKQIEAAFKRAAKKVTSSKGKQGKVKFRGQLDYEAFRLAPDEPAVVAASNVIRQLGHEPVLSVTNGGLDANWMSSRGIPTVTLGCGQLHQHMAQEELHIPTFLLACDIALQLARAN
ncbi:MAG: M20/M25/M40 family metallo-hydrolase [Planctomycetales bacterium]|nr:M20/M25/M40 family metallo-hydrolase [Planctomycetales bacterium]